MKKPVAFAFLVAAAWTWPAAAVQAQQPGALDSRIRTIPYDPDQIVLLRGTLGYQLMIEFDPGEKIQTASIGDSLGWQVTPNRQANVLFLKPMSPSNTNLTVLTDQRRYAFELQVTQREAHEPVLYIARMVYPAPQKAISVLPQPETPPKVANNAYAMSGSKAEQPLRIFDDGHMTYFEWAPDAALPAIFALSGDGSESLVNCIIRGPYVVVDQLARGFVLRNGKDVAKIANHGPATAALP